MLFAGRSVRAKVLLTLALSAGSGSPAIAVVPPRAIESVRAGMVYEISRDVETAEEGSNGSSSSSTDHDTLLERVISVRGDGLELEYDLPKKAAAEDRASNWQLPLRVFKPFNGSLQLLNRPELEARIQRWLKDGGLTHAACGHWVFTWTAVKIECEPQSALATVEAYDLSPSDLRDGASYNDPHASGSTTLRNTVVETGGFSFAGLMSVDPERVRRDQAESDVVIAEISRKALTLDDALRARSSEKVSGTISISFEADPSGFVRQRTKITKLEITEPKGEMKHRMVTEVLKRQIVSGDETSR